MKGTVKIFAIALTLVFGACLRDNIDEGGAAGTSKTPVVNSPEGALGGEILVKFRPEVSSLLDKAQTRAGESGGPMTRSGITTVDQVMDLIGGYELERVFPVDSRHEERTRTSGLHLWYTVRFDENQDVRDVAARLAQLGELAKIEYVHTIQRNYNGWSAPLKRTAVTRAGGTRATYAAFNDPNLDMQWHYINDGNVNSELTVEAGTMKEGSDVNMSAAWPTCTGDPSIIVAVMDEGVMWSHEDLAANIWVNENEVYKSFEDNDDNGYEGDVYGYNFVDDTGVITWDNQADTGHGTHVAGTIAAVNNNGKGVSGIAGGDGTTESGVKIMSLQIFSGNYGVSLRNEVRAIKYAADNGAVILQCSWGVNSALANPLFYGTGGFYDDEEYVDAMPLEKEAFEYFIHHAGSPYGVIDGGVVIFAAGNEYAAMASYPGAYKDFISVAAMAGDFTPATYTNFGPGTNITAPGGDKDYHQGEHGSVLSTLPPQHGNYGYMDGTSMACPHVSGVAALGLSRAAKLHKHFTSREYRELLLASVRPIESEWPAEKSYYKDWSYAGAVVADKMNLSFYKNKMGVGLIDAAAMLTGVAGAGTAITLPNVYLAVDGVQTIDVTRCFDNGESATFTATSANHAIATVHHIAGTGRVTITGHAVGTTTFTVHSSGGGSQTAHITVQRTAGGAGWL